MKYKTYPKYKNIGFDWLNEIPEHWNPILAVYSIALISAAVTGKIDVRDWKKPGDVV
ncbi:MAG: hypothetical protein U9N32_06590 [Spirochaetota bacterium]|nr:hypothetical protein [Spirochaetota bacterium]